MSGSWPLPGQISRCCTARKGSSYQTSDGHPHFKGEQTSSEARPAYLEHIVSLERPKTSMQRMQLLGRNYPSGADAPPWRLVYKGASCPPSISCISTSLVLPHPISLEAGNPKDMGAGREKGDPAMPKHQAFRSQIIFTKDTALSAPRALSLLSWETLYEKDIPYEGWEGDVFLLEWMVPSMHVKLQSAPGLQKREREGSSGHDTRLVLTG